MHDAMPGPELTYFIYAVDGRSFAGWFRTVGAGQIEVLGVGLLKTVAYPAHRSVRRHNLPIVLTSGYANGAHKGSARASTYYQTLTILRLWRQVLQVVRQESPIPARHDGFLLNDLRTGFFRPRPLRAIR